MLSCFLQVKSWANSSQRNAPRFRLSKRSQFLLIDDSTLVEETMNRNPESKGFSFITAFPD